MESFLSHSSKKFGRGTNSSVLCFRKFVAAKNFEKGGKEYQRFQSKTFCLTVPKNLVEEAFCAVFQKFSGMEKF